MLRRRRTLALGLGLPAALLCMIPLLAIVVMPVAFAGGVLVALDVLGLPHSGKPRRGRRASSLKRPCLPAIAPGNQAHGP
jgi:hypothetical protein